MKIVECVPNISDGQNPEIYNAVAQAAAAVAGVELLDVDPGQETNRTVITFVGEPEAVLEGAFELIRKSYELIDMRTHHGAHGRQGATDVCPFVPVSGVTMDECVELSKRLGKRVGRSSAFRFFFTNMRQPVPNDGRWPTSERVNTRRWKKSSKPPSSLPTSALRPLCRALASW